MILGIDVSTYLEELEHGARFFDGEREIDPLAALADNGVSCMRIRVWNDPRGEDGTPYLAGNCDIDNYVRLGKLAKSRGYSLLLDFHYSDFWADPAKQLLPKAWREFSFDEVCDAVYSFTRSCLETAVENGVAPAYIQVGNEITHGILWPHGRLEEDGKRGNYDGFCRLIKAGVRACREICPEAKLILHLERSNDAAVYQEFYTKMDEFGVDYDVIGASYYTYWHGTPDELFSNLRACRRFGKPIMIMELGYGFTDEPYYIDGKAYPVIIDAKRAYIEGLSEKYPFTHDGQARFIRDLLARARADGIAGAFYWEPLWIPRKGICWASESSLEYIGEVGKPTANEWANQCMFDYDGQKLPVFDEYKN